MLFSVTQFFLSRGHPIPSSLLFTSTSVICGTDPILEIDLQSGQVEPYLGPEELAKIYKEKPIEIFRIYSPLQVLPMLI